MKRIIPKDKIEGLRFGQLLVAALTKSGHWRQEELPYDEYNYDVIYKVLHKDLFYLENDELEKIIQDFLEEQL